MTTLYEEARDVMNSISDIKAAVSVMSWDQEVLMSPGGTAQRAEQLAGLDTLSHRLLTGATTRALVGKIRADWDSFAQHEREVLEVFVKDFDMAIKLPDSLVQKMSHVQAIALEEWKKARAGRDFSLFAPVLQQIVDLKIEAAELCGYAGNRLDALMDLYEPGLTVAQVEPVFMRLREGIRNQLAALEHRSKPDDAFLKAEYPQAAQLALARSIVEKLGFIFNNGRLDLSTHPFCTTFANTDVRLTTRVQEDDFRTCLFSVIHEGGHGMYEQGVESKYFRTAAEHGTSMGIHESQSLFWEDIIARSREFWDWAMPQVRAAFPGPLSDVSAEQMYKAINIVNPGFIRIDADEVTYHMHIILRFEMEKALINREIAVNDIPAAWNAKMQEYLGITPPNDALGCLQDIHWSFGGIGYFPSYSLGKLYAAMMWEQLRKEMPEVHAHIGSGNFGPIREWLREKVHRFGRTRNSGQIIQGICGRSLSEQSFLHYIGEKLDTVYGG